MRRSIRLTAQAHRDLSRLEDFLIDKNPSAARCAGQIIAASIRSLAEYAERGQIGPRKDLRRLQVPFGDSGYVVEYQITPTEVLITRIKHARER